MDPVFEYIVALALIIMVIIVVASAIILGRIHDFIVDIKYDLAASKKIMQEIYLIMEEVKKDGRKRKSKRAEEESSLSPFQGACCSRA